MISKKTVKKIGLGILLLVAAPAICWAAPAADQVCRSQTTTLRTSALEDLARLEEDLVAMDWQSWKYREIVYVPMWHAGLKMNERFSSARRAEGEVSFGRYRHLAAIYQSNAREARQRVVAAWNRFHRNVQKGKSVCSVLAYGDCFAAWRDPLTERLQELQKILEKYFRKQIQLNQFFSKTVQESPSDHGDFAIRFQHELNEQNVQAYPLLLGTLRELREMLESAEPLERCCQICDGGETLITRDPVTQRLKPDAEGANTFGKGISSPRSIVRAFDELGKKKSD